MVDATEAQADDAREGAYEAVRLGDVWIVDLTTVWSSDPAKNEQRSTWNNRSQRHYGYDFGTKDATAEGYRDAYGNFHVTRER